MATLLQGLPWGGPDWTLLVSELPVSPVALGVTLFTFLKVSATTLGSVTFSGFVGLDSIDLLGITRGDCLSVTLMALPFFLGSVAPRIYEVNYLSATLMVLPFSLRNVIPRTNLLGSPSTTITVIRRTRSSGMKASAIGTPLWTGLAGRSDPFALELTCPWGRLFSALSPQYLWVDCRS